MLQKLLSNLDKLMLLVVILSQVYLMTGADIRTNSTVIAELRAEVTANRALFDRRNQWMDSTVVVAVRALAVGECLDRTYKELTQMQLSCERLFREMGMTYIPKRD